METKEQKNWENFERTGKISYYLAMKGEQSEPDGPESAEVKK